MAWSDDISRIKDDPAGVLLPVLGWALLLAAVLYGVVQAGVAATGPSRCRDDILETEPEVGEEYVLRGGMWTREYDGHWIVVVRVIPKNLGASDEEALLVCHYGQENYVLSRLEALDADAADHLREVSSSILNPLR